MYVQDTCWTEAGRVMWTIIPSSSSSSASLTSSSSYCKRNTAEMFQIVICVFIWLCCVLRIVSSVMFLIKKKMKMIRGLADGAVRQGGGQV
jgi:hypothetical protein